MPKINRLLIEVADTNVETRRYDGSNGEERSYKVQNVYLHMPGKRYAKEFPRRIPADGVVVGPGWYEQDYSDLWTNFSFNRAEMTLSKLVPVPDNQVRATLESWKD